MMKKLVLLIAAITLLTGCSSAPAQPGRETSGISSNKITESETDTEKQTVTFGSYRDQAIKWNVLAREDGKVLLLSVHALDSKPFSETPATWDESSLRSWLNKDFYQSAFNEQERSSILKSSLESADDLKYGTRAGKNTEDYVFLLSASEAEKFLSKDEMKTSPTEYAAAQGAYTNENGDCAWWLRSPGINDNGPAYYSSQGDIGTRAHAASEDIIGVRPAIWVKAE